MVRDVALHSDRWRVDDMEYDDFKKRAQRWKVRVSE